MRNPLPLTRGQAEPPRRPARRVRAPARTRRHRGRRQQGGGGRGRGLQGTGRHRDRARPAQGHLRRVRCALPHHHPDPLPIVKPIAKRQGLSGNYSGDSEKSLRDSWGASEPDRPVRRVPPAVPTPGISSLRPCPVRGGAVPPIGPNPSQPGPDFRRDAKWPHLGGHPPRISVWWAGARML
jgi:hypothetical protein